MPDQRMNCTTKSAIYVVELRLLDECLYWVLPLVIRNDGGATGILHAAQPETKSQGLFHLIQIVKYQSVLPFSSMFDGNIHKPF